MEGEEAEVVAVVTEVDVVEEGVRVGTALNLASPETQAIEMIRTPLQLTECWGKI